MFRACRHRQARENSRQARRRPEKNGIDRSPVFGMKPREPGRQEMIPAGDQGEARISAELETVGRDVVAQQQDDREGSEKAQNWNVMKTPAERLGDGGRHVDGFRGAIREDRSSSKDVEEGDDRRGDKTTPTNVPTVSPASPAK